MLKYSYFVGQKIKVLSQDNFQTIVDLQYHLKHGIHSTITLSNFKYTYFSHKLIVK